jgi:hypothetical protein
MDDIVLSLAGLTVLEEFIYNGYILNAITSEVQQKLMAQWEKIDSHFKSFEQIKLCHMNLPTGFHVEEL